MCWPTQVDSYRPPAPRYAKATRYRRYSPSPPPVRRIERTYIRRAPSPLPLPPPPSAPIASIAPPPPPISICPPSTKAPSKAPSKAPTAVPDPPPPPSSAAKSKAPSAAPSKAPSAAPSAAKSKAPTAAPSKAPSDAPSAAKSKAPTEAPPPPASNAGSKKSKATYVEVTNEEDNASSASSGVMSGSKSNYTHKTSASRRSSAPPSEYSIHEREKEIRRYMRPVNDWETYRYVDAPAPPLSHSRHRSSSSRRDSGAPRDDFDRELKISIKR